MSYYHDWIEDEHYADEIEGRAEYPVPSSEETPVLLNAPGQLRFPFESGL